MNDDNAALELVLAYQQLEYWWKLTGSCPCGARRESLNSHPHVSGCPTAARERIIRWWEAPPKQESRKQLEEWADALIDAAKAAGRNEVPSDSLTIERLQRERDEAMAVLRDAGLALASAAVNQSHRDMGVDYFYCHRCSRHTPVAAHAADCILAHPLLVAAMKSEEGNDG